MATENQQSDQDQSDSIADALPAFNIYSLANSGYLASQALVFLFAPSLLINALSSHTRDATDVETHLCHVLALTCLFGAIVSLPGPDESSAAWLYWVALLVYHGGVFIFSYLRWLREGQSMLLLGMIGSGTLFAWGLGSLVFQGEGRRARSSYLFPASEKRRMKVEKREKKFGKLETKMG